MKNKLKRGLLEYVFPVLKDLRIEREQRRANHQKDHDTIAATLAEVSNNAESLKRKL